MGEGEEECIALKFPTKLKVNESCYMGRDRMFDSGLSPLSLYINKIKPLQPYHNFTFLPKFSRTEINANPAK